VITPILMRAVSLIVFSIFFTLTYLGLTARKERTSA
jgi:hypothetical protein